MQLRVSRTLKERAIDEVLDRTRPGRAFRTGNRCGAAGNSQPHAQASRVTKDPDDPALRLTTRGRELLKRLTRTRTMADERLRHGVKQLTRDATLVTNA